MTVITTEPKIEQRAAQHYLGIRVQIPHQELGSLFPTIHDEIISYMQANAIEPAGAPFLRYHVINMADKLDIEFGWFVAEATTGNGRVQAGVLPAGRYAHLIYTDVAKGIEGNSVLIGWAKENNIAWDRWDDPNGDAFRSRYETFITDPDDDPNPSNWKTEVAIKLAE